MTEDNVITDIMTKVKTLRDNTRILLMRYDRMKNLLNKFMYHDYTTICHQIPVIDDEGAGDFAVEIIYSNIPCKLSQYGKQIISTVIDRQKNHLQIIVGGFFIPIFN